MTKLVKEIKQKIKVINQQAKQDQMTDQDQLGLPAAIELADESAYDSQGDAVNTGAS